MTDTRRRCGKCNRLKAYHLFYRKEWRLKNRRPWCKACYKKTPAYKKDRERYYQRKYGLTFDEYRSLLADQHGCCYICRRKSGNRSLSVDHNHSMEFLGMKESIRGLLCGRCNEFLGHIRDDVIAVYRIEDYLTRPTWVERMR